MSIGEVTALLRQWQLGDAQSRDRALATLYGELRGAARHALRSRPDELTLQATALLNEALLKFINRPAPEAVDRHHFIAIVSQAIRQVLVDHARRRNSDKRGAGERPLPIDVERGPLSADPTELLALDDALRHLERLDANAAHVVELRVFAGFTIEETAHLLGLHPSAVNREWASAVAWLKEHAFPDG